jgi:DNA-binding response OmpR family regulator
MVVDDEPAIGQMLTRFLGKHNYEVIFFTSGKEALAYLKDNTVSLLLMDWLLERSELQPTILGSKSGAEASFNCRSTDMIMPGITGVELARQVKTLYPTMPIIVMSGSADGPDRDRIFELGADFIPKPFNLVDLVRKFKERGL